MDNFARIPLDEVLELYHEMIPFIAGHLKKNEIDPSLFIEFTKMAGLHENLARAYEGEIHGVYTRYLQSDLLVYALSAFGDLQDREKTVDSLIEKIRAQGLEATIEKEVAEVFDSE